MEITKRRSGGIRVPVSRRVFVVFNTIILLAISFAMLYPVLYVIAASFSEETAILRGDVVFIPVGAHVKAYQKVFQYPLLWQSYGNTLLYTFLGTAINLILTVFGAWALSRKKMVGRRFFTLMCTFTMFFNGGMIPIYLNIRDLGLYNTLWALILPGAISVYNCIICRTAIQAVPDSLTESAYLDGANDLVIVFRITLPLIMPTIAVLLLYYGVGHWNAWFPASIYLQDNNKLPIQNIMRSILIANSNLLNSSGSETDRVDDFAETIKYSTIILTTVPVLCIYPFLQKYFVKGVMVGAVKG